MKRTFTVRLPIKAPRSVRHLITQRVHADTAIIGMILGSLVDSGMSVSSEELFPFARERLREAGKMLSGDVPLDVWESRRMACVYQALNEYRSAVRYADEKLPGGFNKRNVARVLETRAKSVDIYAPLNKRLGLSESEDWEAVEGRLLDLIFTGKGRVAISVGGVGEFEVAGAGTRERGAEAVVNKVLLENRGDRYYLCAEVTHKTSEQPPQRIRPEGGAINIYFTSATWVADDIGLSLQMYPAASSVMRRRLAARDARDNGGDLRGSRTSSRKSMDARHNFVRQYAALVVHHATEHKMAVVVSPKGSEPQDHPFAFGRDKRQRKEVVDEIFRQCRRMGVPFIVEESSRDVKYSNCGHQRAWVGVLSNDRTMVRAMCRECAEAELSRC